MKEPRSFAPTASGCVAGVVATLGGDIPGEPLNR